VPATLERLETLSVPVLGFGTDRFPGFYLRDSGEPCAWRVDDLAQVVEIVAAHRAVGHGAGVVLANPVPAEAELDPELHDRLLAEGLDLVHRRQIHGREVTPVLLEHFHLHSAGASLACNIALVKSNAALAAELAVALSSRTPT
jgi:pseudouridylate synthase